jgi:hypothetical protein
MNSHFKSNRKEKDYSLVMVAQQHDIKNISSRIVLVCFLLASILHLLYSPHHLNLHEMHFSPNPCEQPIITVSPGDKSETESFNLFPPDFELSIHLRPVLGSAGGQLCIYYGRPFYEVLKKYPTWDNHQRAPPV